MQWDWHAQPTSWLPEVASLGVKPWEQAGLGAYFMAQAARLLPRPRQPNIITFNRAAQIITSGQMASLVISALKH